MLDREARERNREVGELLESVLVDAYPKFNGSRGDFSGLG